MSAQSQGNIIDSEQTITGAWADLGGEIECLTYDRHKGTLNLDINDSRNIKVRVVSLEESGGSETVIARYTERPNDSEIKDRVFIYRGTTDKDLEIIVDILQRYKIIKYQIMADTVGSTAGKILTATYRQGYTGA